MTSPLRVCLGDTRGSDGYADVVDALERQRVRFRESGQRRWLDTKLQVCRVECGNDPARRSREVTGLHAGKGVDPPGFDARKGASYATGLNAKNDRLRPAQRP